MRAESYVLSAKSPVIPSRREEFPGEAARAQHEGTRFATTRLLVNEFALRAEILRGGSE